ncbi:MAG: AarF/ABC1/UbiB kinase family protein [Saprospiraceae bacterium]|nr:AarF/ABC1/UbiB kinase family protein [Saprospiraceae bacterium]
MAQKAPTKTGKDKHPTTLMRRYEQVIGTLLKFGFADIISHPPFSRFIPASRKFIPVYKGKPVTDYTRYERIRFVCEELGTTFIKFAQIASNRPDLLPDELLVQLTSFQDHAPEVPEEVIREILTEEYKAPPEEIFLEFDPKPVASASMAQVHRAVRTDGTEVALKILRPGIQDTIEQDIHILRQLAHLLETYFPEYQSFQPMELVKMFETSIRKELHLRLEAANLVRFGRNFKDHADIHVPRYFAEHSTDRILCMEFIRGFKITDLETLKTIGLSGPALALKGINLYFEQVFEHGFFHADPHPGNIFILADQRVCFVDYGMMGMVLDSDKILMANLLLAIADRDVKGLKKALLRFSKSDRLEPEQDKELEYDIAEFLADYSGISLEDIESMEVMNGVNRLFFNYKIRVPANLLLLLKALVIIEGVGLQLDPRYNIIENITPFVRRLLARKYHPALMGRTLLKAAGDMVSMVGNLPEDMTDILRKIRQGRLHIEFEHRGLEPLIREMDLVSNRISFAIVIAALILGSALLVIAHIPPYIYNISALGFFGFLISGLLAIRLAWAIIRHGRI